MVLASILKSVRRWRKCTPNGRRNTRLQVEQLESRLTPSAYLDVDFGFNFPGGALTVTNSQMQDKGVNGPTGIFGNGYSLISIRVWRATIICRPTGLSGGGSEHCT